MKKAQLRFFAISVAMVLALVSLCMPAAAQEAQERIGRREWTCHASIFLGGTSHQYTPPTWKMKTGDPHVVWGDREKSCRRYIEARILTPSIWSRLNLAPVEKERFYNVCRGRFRVEYGFDRRPKSWSFIKDLRATPCWTSWIHRDRPSGTGDFETLRDFLKTGQACANPTGIQCRLAGTRQLVQTGLVNGRERYRCDVAVGGVCDNRQQSSGISCSDYEVRFLCP